MKSHAHTPRLPSSAQRTFARWNALAGWLTCIVPHDLLALAARVGIAVIFFLSGRTKVEDVLTLTGSARELFRTEYRLLLVPPEIAAHLAAYAEHLFPVLCCWDCSLG